MPDAGQSGVMVDNKNISPALLAAQATLEKRRAEYAALKAARKARPALESDHNDLELARARLTTAGPDPRPRVGLDGASTRQLHAPSCPPSSQNDLITADFEQADRSASAPDNRGALRPDGGHATITVTRPDDAGFQPTALQPVAPSGRAGETPTADHIDVTTPHLPAWWDEATAAVSAGRQWGSAAMTAAIQRALANNQGQGGGEESAPAVDWTGLASLARAQQSEEKRIAGGSGHGIEPCSVPTGDVKHYITLGSAALQAGQATLYRVWLAARYLDTAGSGWCDVQDLRQFFDTGISWRRLRQVMNQGEGRWWARERGRGVVRLRYTSAADLALLLDIERLTGVPVSLPARVLLDSIGEFKAMLVASIHASRADQEGETAPISRQCLAELNGVSVRTLQRYDKRAGVRAVPNYEVGNPVTPESAQEAAWDAGTAHFELTDHRGKQGPAGRKYNARQLPNSYIATKSETAPRGRQRKINKCISNARDNGARANGNMFVRRFHLSAVGAYKVATRRPHSGPIFWRSGHTRAGAGVWHRVSVG